jgi:hypothetical protein
MSRTRTTRLLAVSVITTLVAGLLALIGVGIGPAQADHGTLTLEVSREVTNVTEGTEVELVARLFTSRGLPPTPDNLGAGVEIDWEFEGGTWDGENGAVTPRDPDASCFIVAPSPSTPTSYPPRCSIKIPASAAPGTGLIRAWIDHDHTDGDQKGGTEADMGETRLSGDGDCVTEVQYLPADESEEAVTDCLSEGDGADAGDTAEYDDTDVVRVTIRPRAAVPAKLVCPPTTVVGLDETAEVTCQVLTKDNLPVNNATVDAKHISGANDPDSNASSKDYTGVSNASGFVTLEIPAVDGDQDFALICAWVDTDEEDDGTGVPIIGTDPEYGSDPGDGGYCNSDPNDNNTADADPPAEMTAGNHSRPNTDAFYVNWQERQLARVDVTPETAQSFVGQNHTLTARVFDQLGGAFNGPATTVKFELLTGSAADSDGSTLISPDLSCTTSGSGEAGGNTCTVTYTSSKVGTDTVCAWIEVDDENFSVDGSCNGEKQADNAGGDAVDVVTKTWNAPQSTSTPAKPDQGYSLVGGDGGIFNYGNAEFHGSTGNLRLNQPIIGIAYMPGGTGYWLVAKDGGVFTFGAAKFHGSMGDQKLNAPVLGMESTPTGKGYWLFAADGGIFTFGDAQFHGSTGNMRLNAPMIGMGITQEGDGYWLVAQDGGVFTFNAPFYGSTGDKKLNEPVFDIGPAPGNAGYWLVARDGGIFTFGNVAFYGSAANVPGRSTVVGIGVTPSGKGYWVADVNGKVMPFGDGKFFGDRSTSANNAPMVGFAAVPKG